MKRFFASLAMAMFLAACGQGGHEQQSGASTTSTPEPAPPTTPPVKAPPRAAPEGEKGVDLLAGNGIALDFPHEINYDIIDTSRNGTPRHRVLVEVLGGDFPAVVQQFTATLAGTGYRKGSEKNDVQRIEQVYVKRDQPTLYLLMQPAGTGPKLKNPDSTGSIHIMWNKR